MSSPAQVSPASTSTASSMKPCATSINWRRSMLSASAPAASAKSMTGSVAAACTSATMSGVLVRPVISQPAPTCCNWVPRFDTSAAPQIIAKAR